MKGRVKVLLLIFLFLLPLARAAAQDSGNEASYEAEVAAFRIFLDEGYVPDEQELEELAGLTEQLEETPYLELTNEARMLLTIGREKRQQEGGSAAEPVTFDLPVYPGGGAALTPRQMLGVGISLGSGFSSLGLFNAFSFLSNVAYERYISTASPRNAYVLQRTWMLYDLLKYVFLGTGILSFGAAVPLFLGPGEYLPAPEISRDKLLTNREKLVRQLERGEKNSAAWKTAGEISLGTGLTSLLATALSFTLSELFHYRYSAAQFTDDAVSSRERVYLFETIGISAGNAAAAGLLTAALSVTLPKDTGMIERRIDTIDIRIAAEDDADDIATIREAYLRQRIGELERQRAGYREKLEKARELRPVYSAITFSSLGVGAVSLIGMGISAALGVEYFEEYNNQRYSADAAAELRKLNIVDTVSYVTGIVGTVGIGTSIFTALLRPDEGRLEKNIERIDGQIEEFQRQLEEPGLLF